MAKLGVVVIGGTLERMHNFFPVTLGMCQSKHLRNVIEQDVWGQQLPIKKKAPCVPAVEFTNLITHSEQSQCETNITNAVGPYQAF